MTLDKLIRKYINSDYDTNPNSFFITIILIIVFSFAAAFLMGQVTDLLEAMINGLIKLIELTIKFNTNCEL